MLTGKPGSGKTTLWKKIWGDEPEKLCGYLTVPCERDGAFAGYEMQDLLTGERAAISRREGERFVGIEEAFAGFGTELLKKAAESDREILILDELGRFEKNCGSFLSAVQDAVNCGKTVCLVLKKEPVPFLERLKESAGGFLIDLDETGRAKAEEQLLAAVRQSRLSYAIQTRLYLEEKSFGPGPMQLLQDIRENGSLSHAAKRMGMSYSKAWTILKGIEAEWGFELLKKQAGGKQGGSSVLTAQGEELLKRYEAFCRDIEEAAGKSFEKHFDRPIFS